MSLNRTNLIIVDLVRIELCDYTIFKFNLILIVERIGKKSEKSLKHIKKKYRIINTRT